ncbi:MAG: FlgD immunoglobulin-like domain containing protein [Candidatus Neomarinimicrobiota bacterium]
MRHQFLFMLLCLSFLNIGLSQNKILPPIVAETVADEVTSNNQTDQSQSRIIIGQGATIIIRSGDNDNARILVKVVEIKSGGALREVLSEENIAADVSEIIQKNNELQNSLAVPLEFTIEKAYPNPFNPVVNIHYGLPESAPVHIVIHDLSGRRILDYNVGEKSAGWHDFQWDGTDVAGKLLGSGIYFVTIQVSEIIKNQKVTFVK